MRSRGHVIYESAPLPGPTTPSRTLLSLFYMCVVNLSCLSPNCCSNYQPHPIAECEDLRLPNEILHDGSGAKGCYAAQSHNAATALSPLSISTRRCCLDGPPFHVSILLNLPAQRQQESDRRPIDRRSLLDTVTLVLTTTLHR